MAAAGHVLERSAPGDLLSVAGSFLAAREARHSYLLGMADRMRRQPERFADTYAACVRRGPTILLAAAWVPPYHLHLSTTDDPQAVDLVADDLARRDPAVFGVNAPDTVADRFVAAWAERTGRQAVLDMRSRTFQLDRVTPPARAVPGRARFATPEDGERLAAWVEAFRAEALPGEPSWVPGSTVVESWLARPEPVVWLWEHDGQVVSMAVAGARTPHGVRIGSVYTPPALRRRGYASALMAAASQGELDRGRSMCFLDADLANPTSNRIYEAIGYAPVGDVLTYRFVPPEVA